MCATVKPARKPCRRPAFNTNGAIAWEGPSLLDGAPLACIITGLSQSSTNTKTGGMLQVYIIRADMHPLAALESGADVSICGVCPHKGVAAGGSGACYVQVGKAPSGVYRCYAAGRYRRLEDFTRKPRGGVRMTGLENLAGRKVRFGAYGDPAAVPVHVWEALAAAAAGVTGYTHQWRTADRAMARWCMASADSVAEGIAARHDYGYRSFIVRAIGSAKPRGAVVCPASAEAGKRTVCASCMACGGTDNGRRQDVTIVAHGATARRFAPLPLMVV